jgi:hypothetical protein
VRRPGRRFNGAVLSLSLSFGYMTVGAFLTQMYYDRRLFFFFFFLSFGVGARAATRLPLA